MAASPLNTKSYYHVRSISLPSRSHPLNLHFEERLSKLRASAGTSSTLSSICSNIGALTDLFDCVHDLLLLPHIQQKTTIHGRHKQFIDNELDASLRLLDVCGTTKDALLQMKESTQELQSILRRRRGSKLELENEIGEHLASGKKVKKAIQMSLRKLKSMEDKCTFSPLDKSHDIVAIACLFTELEAVTFCVFESLLSYISGLKVRSRLSGWSLVSKLMHSKYTACREEAPDISEFEKVDSELRTLIVSCRKGKSKNLHVENVQISLGKLESNIQDLEEGLDCLFRHLIKARVALLNILNHSS
ncbi:uncharacterized protein LOC131155063 [Malania oleifera]|uniref:uncharacterized protein LOC131155063 n=1 Tax=Malania oleifera TaxID=397392 RepID=UPI0025AEB384|nr:uncharacterized protein LOC131155063 [Malania oleifera]